MTAPLERAVAALWSAVLGGAVPVTEPFPALGGDRAAAAELTGLVRETFEVTVPPEELFGAVASVRDMTAVIRSARRLAAGVDRRPPGAPPAPLSFGQQRLWLLHEFADESSAAAYHVPIAFRLLGALDQTALRTAVDALVARHEVLRTRIEAGDGVPVQVVDPAAPVPLPVTRVADTGTALRRATEEVREPFDLETGPVFRARLFRVDPDEHLLVLTVPHLSVDGAGKEVPVAGLGAAYTAALSGVPAGLPAPPVTYADFATWQRKRLTGDVLEPELDWWRERLAGWPTALSLPIDRPRPEVADHRGSASAFVLDPDTTGALREVARAHGATVFMALLAAVQAFLSRLCGMPRVLLGVPSRGRTRPETEGVVGFFINTLVLRGDLGGDPDFGTLVDRARQEALGAYAHQDVPFEHLVREFAPDRDLARNPLVQVLVQVEPDDPVPSMPGVTAVPLDNLEAGVRADLELHVHDDGETLHGQLVHATALFTPSRAAALKAALLSALTALATRPTAPIATLTWPDPASP